MKQLFNSRIQHFQSRRDSQSSKYPSTDDAGETKGKKLPPVTAKPNRSSREEVWRRRKWQDVEREKRTGAREARMAERKSSRLSSTRLRSPLIPRDPATLISAKLECSAHIGTSLGGSGMLLESSPTRSRSPSVRLRLRKPKPQIVVATRIVDERLCAFKVLDVCRSMNRSLFLRDCMEINYSWEWTLEEKWSNIKDLSLLIAHTRMKRSKFNF